MVNFVEILLAVIFLCVLVRVIFFYKKIIYIDNQKLIIKGKRFSDKKTVTVNNTSFKISGNQIDSMKAMRKAKIQFNK